ncbi:MAG: hypothetical protein AAF941_08705 [Pseudomonadota bacterium]
MKRSLIAFLALLSGLAALGSPAQASAVNAIACDIGVSAEVAADKAGTPAEIREATKKRPVRCRKLKAPKRFPLPQSLQVPIVMGIERAFE